MAILDNNDFRDIKKIILADDVARTTFKEWGLSKSALQDLFQSAEDWFVNAFLTTPITSFKGALELSDAGAMINTQAKQTGFVWVGWRFGANP